VEQAILKHNTYGEALSYRLAMKCGGQIVKSEILCDIFIECLQLSREIGKKEEDIEILAMEDLISVEKNDPACRSLAQALLYFKGYKAIQCYRMAHILWESKRIDIAMLIQARCTEVFGKLIHIDVCTLIIIIDTFTYICIYEYMNIYHTHMCIHT
jgi:serine O-acetyltransferase